MMNPPPGYLAGEAKNGSNCRKVSGSREKLLRPPGTGKPKKSLPFQ
jgi:hypothetical protein